MTDEPEFRKHMENIKEKENPHKCGDKRKGNLRLVDGRIINNVCYGCGVTLPHSESK